MAKIGFIGTGIMGYLGNKGAPLQHPFPKLISPTITSITTRRPDLRPFRGEKAKQ